MAQIPNPGAVESITVPASTTTAIPVTVTPTGYTYASTSGSKSVTLNKALRDRNLSKGSYFWDVTAGVLHKVTHVENDIPNDTCTITLETAMGTTASGAALAYVQNAYYRSLRIRVAGVNATIDGEPAADTEVIEMSSPQGLTPFVVATGLSTSVTIRGVR